MTVKGILKAVGSDKLALHGGKDYWYFVYDDSVVFQTHSVFVSKLRDLSFDQWVQEGKDFLDKIGG